MKKCFSLLLTLAMLLSMVPAVSAAESVEAAAPETAAEETVSIDPEQIRETVLASSPADYEDIDSSPVEIYEEMPETAVLGASNITIKGTVTLPDAADADSQLRVYAIVIPETDDNGKVLGNIGYYGGTNVEVSSGKKTASYSISVPAGKYALAVYNYVPGAGTYMGYTYFNADGTVADNEYVAVPANFTSGKTIDLTMPKGEYTINGTLEFSSKATQDVDIQIDLGQNSSNGSWQNQDLVLKKGQDSLDFSFVVEEGSYYMECYSNISSYGWLYADIYGGLSQDWENHLYAGAYGDDSTIDLTIDGDLLLAQKEGEDGPTGTEIQVTVNLPAKLEKRTQFRTALMNSSGNTTTVSKWVDAGATSYTVSLYTTYSSFAVGYYDSTNVWSNYNIRYAGDVRFAAEDGITTNYKNATYFTSADTTKVTINEPSCYALKGTLKLESARDVESALYVLASFEDGERYGARAYFDYKETSVNYVIYVPTSQKGNTYELWAAETYEGNSNRVLDASCIGKTTGTLTGNATLGTITVPDPPITLTGTFALPEGMTAPKGGLAVEINFDYESPAIYILEEGESSFDYELTPEFEDNYSYNLNAFILNAPDNLGDEISIYAKGSELNGLTLQACETVTVSGSITVPEACRDAGTTVGICSYSNVGNVDYDNYIYVTVLPGQISASYSAKAPKDYRSQFYTRVDADGTGKLLCSELYLQQDGTIDTDYDNVTLTKDLSGVNFDYIMGKIISGTISAVLSGEYYGYVYAQGVKSNETYDSPYIRFDGTETTYSLAVPLEDDGETYKLYLNMHDGPEGALVDTQLYWSENGMVSSSSEATAFTVPATGITKNLTIPKAKTVSGSILVGKGLPADGYYSGYVYVITKDTEYRTYFDSSDGRMSFNVNLPENFDGTCNLAVYCYSSENTPDNLVTYTNLYVAEDGTMTADKSKAKAFTVSADGLTQDVTIMPGRTFTITLNAPAGLSGDYEGRLYLYSLDNNRSTSQDFTFSGTSGSLSYTVPYGVTNYGLQLRVYSGPGVLTNTFYYSNGTWSTNYNSMTAIPMQSDTLSLTLPAAKTISGKLVSSDGSAVSLGEDGGYITLYKNGSSVYSNVSSTVYSDGTFTVSMPQDYNDSYTIRFYPYTSYGNNVVSKDYYYQAGATSAVTANTNATAIDMSAGNVSGINLMVDTGWLLTGQVKLGEGVTLSSTRENGYAGDVNIYLQEIVEDGVYNYMYASASADLYENESAFAYSLVVPKTAASYNLRISSIDITDDATTNMYQGEMPKQVVSVSGNTTLPDLMLSKAKAAITATIKSDLLAADNNDVYLNLYISAGENEYSAGSWLYSGDSISVTIPEAETSQTYKMYYRLSSGDGLHYGPVYVGANGTLTTNEDEAATLSWSTTSHTLNLLEIPPYLTGKIYLNGYTDETFTIYLSGYNSNSVNVTPDKVKTAEDGRKYVDYALVYAYANAGNTYSLYCRASYSSGTAVEDTLWVDEYYYVNPDGTVTSNWNNAQYFTIPEGITTVLDFTLADWDTISGDCILHSAHNIVPSADPVTYTYTYVYPGITSNTRMKITFNDLSDVGVTINGVAYSYSTSTRYVDTEDGVITIEMTVSSSDYSGESYYGFGITGIQPTSGHSVSSVADNNGSVFSASGSSNAAVMADLNAGKPVYVSQAAPSATAATVYAAIYDASGKMLDVIVAPMDFTQYADCAALSFDTGYADAATLKIMLLSNSGISPLMTSRTITR